MRSHLPQVILLLAALAGIGSLTQRAVSAAQGADVAREPESASELKRLQELVRQLREIRQEYYTQKAQDEEAIRAVRRDKDSLRSEVEELREQEAALDAELADYRSQVQVLESAIEGRTAFRQDVARRLAAFVSEQEQQIAEGIPYKQQERLARLQSSSPDPNDATPASVASRLSSLWSYAQEELRLAASSETYTARATGNEGTLPHARYFRVGQSWLAYVTESGQHGAIWHVAPQGGRWHAIVNPEQMAPLRDATEILDQRQAPRFVPLPTVLNVPSPNDESR